MTTVLESIRQRGHWQVVIRPTRFIKERVSDIADLASIVKRSAVSLRGWDYPHVDRKTEVHVDTDWVGQEFEWSVYHEVWRIYQSGQFVHISGMEEDWSDHAHWSAPPQDWRPGSILSIGNALFTITEVFEFASRLAVTDAGDEQMHIEIAVYGLKDRALMIDDSRGGPFYEPHRASIPEYRISRDMPRAELLAEYKSIALEWARQLFQRFGWNPSLDLLREQQEELYRFRPNR